MSSTNRESKKRILVLASGRGSNFEAICRAVVDKQIADAEIVRLICNKITAPVLDIAKRYQVPVTVIESAGISKMIYEKKLLQEMKNAKPDLVCLAGYMKLLGAELIHEFEDRLINIHPSLLPEFRGLNAQQQALDAGVKRTGCTVHWVTQGMDEGAVIEQASLEILEGETVESLSARLLPLEHSTYIRAIKKLLAKQKI